ncbi:MAG: AAA family ATPase, partial [Flavobacterium sp.]|nr:AAA family ATPase [Flavobacterium sp.]
KIKGITSFIQFRWHSLSSGEQSYLSLMSRFYSLVHEESVRLQNRLIILIDEGDAGYHPEWQRLFFKNTIRFLSSLFHNHSIQLIFTSNTPFLTSDLPKSNILFVQKSEDGTPYFLDKQNHNSNTFAANIHTLFSDSFYMDGMLIGEYAKDKINEIIKYLNDQTVKVSNDSYKKIIDSIGEPVLRKKLQDMWFEKFGLQEKLEVLRKQVAEVEQKIKDNNDKSSL